MRSTTQIVGSIFGSLNRQSMSDLGLKTQDPKKYPRGGINEAGLLHQRRKVVELALLLKELNHGLNTYNPYLKVIRRAADLLTKSTPEDVRLYHLLVHGLTLLNKLYRTERNGRYVVAREDLIVAMDIIGIKGTGITKLTHSYLNHYHLLFDYYGLVPFTRQMAEHALRLSKSHTFRTLQKIEAAGLLSKSGHKNRGYYYRLLLPIGNKKVSV